MYRKFTNGLNKVNSGIIAAEKWICFALFIVLLFCLIFQVIARFILHIPAVWTEEFARYSFIMLMWLACGTCLHYGKHVDMNILDSFLLKLKNPKKAFFVMEKVTMVTNLVFCCYFISIYHPYLMKIKKGGSVAVSAPIPMWIFMSAVEIGFILMAWHSFVILLNPPKEDLKAAAATEEKEDK